jgi:hypothetical protein
MIGVPGPRLSPEFLPVIESTEFGLSLPRRVADGRLHLEGRHAGVLADRAFAVGRQVDVLRDDRQRLRRSRGRRLGDERVLHRRAHVGRQVGRSLHDELQDAFEE